MEAMREAWTDDRLDDLANRMDHGFDRVDKDIRDLRVETKSDIAQLRGEMKERFDKVDERFDKVDERFDKVDERFDRVDARFERIEDKFDKVDARFERIDGRLDSIQHAIALGAIGLTSGVIAGFGALIVSGA
jgi:archaellum component FlaC